MQAFDLGTRARFMNRYTAPVERPTLLRAALVPGARQEEPAVQFFGIDDRTCLVDRAVAPVERPVRLEPALVPGARQEEPAVQFFGIDDRTCLVDRAVAPVERPVRLEPALVPGARQEEPAVQFFGIDDRTCLVDRAVAPVERPVLLGPALVPDARREKPAVQSFGIDAESRFTKHAPTSANGCVFSDSIPVNRTQGEETSRKSYVLERRHIQCIRKAMGDEQKCESYNYASWIAEPLSHVHHVYRHETRCRILRFHRYARINPGASK